MTPLISVIVPIYNVEKYLHRCIDSILVQTYSNLEVILVDDGSEDSCAQICDSYAQQDSRVRVIHQKNSGVSAARNVGLNVATGDYIYFVDSDDYIESCLCQRIMSIFDKHNVDIVIFNCGIVNDKSERSVPTEKIREGQISPKEAVCELMRGNINNYLVNKVYKKKIFEGISFPVGRLWEDMAVGYKILLNAKNIYCLPEILYYYYMRSDSIIHTISESALGDIFIARYNSYNDLLDIYPEAAQLVFSRVALCAIRLYDRSLWKEVNNSDLEKALLFLKDNRESVLKLKDNIPYRLYYSFPGLYRFFRISKHKIGNVVKFIMKKG